MDENELMKTKPEQLDEPVFTRPPSEQEISSDLSADDAPVTIYLPGSIRIEIGAGRPILFRPISKP